MKYPLDWPKAYPRTRNRKDSVFKQSLERSQKFLHEEIGRLGGSGLIVSTNIRVRQDGYVYAADMEKLIPDPGVAIYFNHKGKPITMCCDQYRRVWENAYALGKAIEALRGMERWGVSDFIERAFTGFTALPSAIITPRHWTDVLNLTSKCHVEDIKWAYRELCKKHHPDVGGDPNAFIELTTAYESALAEIQSK